MPVVEFNVIDCDCCVADTFPVEFTPEQLTEVVSHAARLVVEHRAHRRIDSVDDLYQAFVDVGIFK